MVEYSVTQEHTAENITLLCPAHHNEKSLKRLPLSRVVAANANPYNRSAAMTSAHPMSCFYGSEFHFALGSNRLLAQPMRDGLPTRASFYIDGGPVLSARVEENEILVRAVIRDRDNNKVLVIRDNELRLAVGLWDVVLTANRLTIWEGVRNIGLEMHFEEAGLHITRGRIYGNGLCCTIKDGVFEMHEFTMVSCELPGSSIYAGVREPINGGVDVGDAIRYLYDAPPAWLGHRGFYNR